MLDINAPYKQIDGYDEYYITNTGDVYANRTREVGWQGLRKLSPRGINNNKRYLQVCLSDKNGKKYHQIHRLVAKHFCDGYFDGAVVNHKDGNIHNNHYTNLEWITQAENVRKSYTSSGVNQVRNYYVYELRNPQNELISTFIGRNQAIKYIKEHNIDASASSLIRHGNSRGYTLQKAC